MKFEKLRFPNAEGQLLGSRLDLPLDGRPFAYALFAHCFTCSKNLRAVHNISSALTEAGIAVLRFDFTGLGESEGDFADTNFSSNVADLVAAARFLEENYAAPQLLIGHSLGGAAVLQAAHALPEVRAVATIGAPANPTHVTHLIEDVREEIEARGKANVSLAGRQFTIKKQFLDDLEEHAMRQTIQGLKRPLLVFHSPLDNTVGVDNAAEIFTAAKHPKSFVSLDKADHLLSREQDARYVGTVLAAWASNYIDEPEPVVDEIPLDDRVFVRTEQGYKTEIRVGKHSLIADEPIAVGGTDLGPNPYEYLLGALGACTTITLRMYANRKALPVEAINVRLSHQKIYAKDCMDCETKTGKVDVIERELEIVGDLTPEQRQRMLEIADKCPVHRTLHSEIKVRTQHK